MFDVQWFVRAIVCVKDFEHLLFEDLSVILEVISL